MNPVSASSLLHFTKDVESLKGILENGFRFSYCSENFSSTINMNEEHPEKATFFRPSPYTSANVAIPMICFCDIPFTRAKSHSDTYGTFVIGIDKDIALTVYGNLLNPVMYRTSRELDLALNDLSVIKAQIEDVAGCHNYKRSINQLLGLTKPYRGLFRKVPDHCYYDEREWRIMLPDHYCDKINWDWNAPADEEEFKVKKIALNKALHSSKYAYIGFTSSLTGNEEAFIHFITHIVVEREKQIPELVQFILNEKQKLFGIHNIPKCVRSLLISKITSLERIEKDF